MKQLFYILIFCLCSLELKAQTVSEFMSTDTIVEVKQSPDLISSFYEGQASLARTYDYELINRQKKYNKWSKDLQNLGVAISVAASIGGGLLAASFDWSPAVYIPCASAVAVGGIFGFLKWAQYYQRKAEAIQVAPVAEYEVGGGVSVQALTLSDRNRRENFGLGIGVTAKF